MPTPRVTILGIGNVLWADEGFGVRAVEALNRNYVFTSDVQLIDGGTQGIYLVQHVEAADILVVFDAIDYGLAPGTLRLVDGANVPNFMGTKKMSLHQTGFQDVLAMARLLDAYPREILLVGVQPQALEDYGGSLRPVVSAQIQPAIDAALAWLAAHHIHARRREPCEPAPALHPVQLDRHSYEALRPSPESACRVGDRRVLADGDTRFDPKPVDLGERPLRVNVDVRQPD